MLPHKIMPLDRKCVYSYFIFFIFLLMKFKMATLQYVLLMRKKGLDRKALATHIYNISNIYISFY